MKNVVVCKNCNSENPLYALICLNCKSYLREKVYNIDFWKTVTLLIEAPSKAFKTIINSEHKNFLVFLIILVSGKILVNGVFLKILFEKGNTGISNYFLNYFFSILLLVLILILFAGLFNVVTDKYGVKTRFLDNFSTLAYSFIPYTFGFVILFPVELILFGGYLFSYSPSPFQIKETLAYTLLVFEGLLIVWNIFLTITAIRVQSGNSFYSLVWAFVIHIVFFISLIFLSIFFFN
jgi:hypothetical protein